eukprot:g1662.t1
MYQRLRRFYTDRSWTVFSASRPHKASLWISQPCPQISCPRVGKQDLQCWLDEGQDLDLGRIQLNEAVIKTSTEVATDQVLFRFPSSLTITSFDAESDPALGPLLEGRGELVKLAIWLMKENTKGELSIWFPFLKTLPERSMSPILWTDNELEKLMFGSPIIQEAKNRREALRNEWGVLAPIINSNPSIFSPGKSTPFHQRQKQDYRFLSLADQFTEEAFLDAFTVILSSAFYLPSAGTFALLPAVTNMKRSGKEDSCTLDYSPKSDEIIISSNRAYRKDEEVCLFDDRSNSERLLTTGSLELDNPSDFLLLNFELVPADRLFTAKRQILESMGYQTNESFPIYEGRIPVQLLSFLRLSRIQDPSQLAQVSFSSDQEISQLNEYEVLQLVLGECRVRLSQYQENWEADVTALKNSMLSVKEKISRELLLTRLAPIRGVPTKSGKLEDPNKDIMDMFKTIEDLPSAPKRALDNFLSWAKGEYDPEWGQKRKR